MSFRLRIFLLVLVVAGTAISATAWLTLSLTSREVIRAEQAREQHQAEVIAEIRRFGVRNGRWPGVDRVVADQAVATRLHIRVVADDGEVLADSDTIEGRTAGPVQLLPQAVDPIPHLDQRIRELAARRAKWVPGADPSAELARANGKPLSEKAAGPRPALPRDLFGVIPAAGAFTEPAAQAFHQVVRYRTALATVRCAADSGLGEPALALDTSPYLSEQQRAAAPGCLRAATSKVLADEPWLEMAWTELSQCRAGHPVYADCLGARFVSAASSTTAVPVEVYFGARQGTGLDGLQQPALIGAAALLVVAALGTAWIARRVSRPVRLLTGASLQLATGRLDVRVPAGGQDELARLSASFNAMAEALQRSEERQRRLIADVAHEMRTPLSNLRGYLEGLADGVIEPSPELFASLHEETLLQRRILDDLQVLALAEAGDLAYSPVPLDLAELAETAATAHRAVAAAAGVDLVVDAPERVRIEADPDRTRQVLGNLLSNAIRYTDAGGRVELRVTRDAHAAILTVRDTGVGMTAEEVARAFDRFWRADPARQRATGGSGLGLTIARRIVADQGGTLEAASTPGLGTTFTVRFPATPADAAATLSGVFSRRARREMNGR
ncbi:sensor histidine kinase [Actinoplanes aureus]|uniref:histidine kinase n=1 Tax=Actinoplanes aureus TaxID=2792083 RepID=A0A931CC73_9ACTN|nr:ATP-binding protein [Actinoplanes aureus]MBG0562225.1 HAMP domain-containing protein [Actinoplanes aureus]